jgi:hypothetical protein
MDSSCPQNGMKLRFQQNQSSQERTHPSTYHHLPATSTEQCLLICTYLISVLNQVPYASVVALTSASYVSRIVFTHISSYPTDGLEFMYSSSSTSGASVPAPARKSFTYHRSNRLKLFQRKHHFQNTNIQYRKQIFLGKYSKGSSCYGIIIVIEL